MNLKRALEILNDFGFSTPTPVDEKNQDYLKFLYNSKEDKYVGLYYDEDVVNYIKMSKGEENLILDRHLSSHFTEEEFESLINRYVNSSAKMFEEFYDSML
jgi:hypothetical protein